MDTNIHLILKMGALDSSYKRGSHQVFKRFLGKIKMLLEILINSGRGKIFISVLVELYKGVSVST